MLPFLCFQGYSLSFYTTAILIHMSLDRTFMSLGDSIRLERLAQMRRECHENFTTETETERERERERGKE